MTFKYSVGQIVQLKEGQDGTVLGSVIFFASEGVPSEKIYKVKRHDNGQNTWILEDDLRGVIQTCTGHKSRPDWIPASVLLGMGDVLAWGKNKYPNNDWKTMDPEMHLAACQRHLLKHAKGEVNDDESGMNHLYHSLVRLAFYTHLTCGAGK